MLPGVDIDQPIHETPRRNTPLIGTKAIFDPLIITFLVDEDMQNYIALYRWIMEMLRTNDQRQCVADATLHILSGQMNPNRTVRFVGLFPTSITELSFGTNDSDNIPATASATFNYQYFDFPDVSLVMGTDDMGLLNMDNTPLDRP